MEESQMEELLYLLDKLSESRFWFLEHVGKQSEPLTLSGWNRAWKGPPQIVDEQLLEDFERLTLDYKSVFVVIAIDGPLEERETDVATLVDCFRTFMKESQLNQLLGNKHPKNKASGSDPDQNT
jgi:hypothetical protein